MNPKLRILLIEDSESDAALLVQELRKGGYEPEYQMVDTVDKFISALDNEKWDLIITEYSLPDFSGINALEILDKRDGHFPAIMVSSNLGEKTAAEALNAGASQTSNKDDYTRLVPILKRVLREADLWKEHQAVLEELRQSEIRYRAVVEDQTEFINRYNLDGVITFANSAYSGLFNKSPEEVIG